MTSYAIGCVRCGGDEAASVHSIWAPDYHEYANPWRDPDPLTVEEDAEDTIALEAAMRRLRDGRRLEDYPTLQEVMAEFDAEDAKRRRRVFLALGVGAALGFVAGWVARSF